MISGSSGFRDRKGPPKDRESVGFCLYLGTTLCTIGVGGCYAVADWRMTMEFTIVGYVGLVLIIAGLVSRFIHIK